MFNSKLLAGIAYAIGGLLVVKAVFVLTMFIWSYFGQPPLALFNPGADQILNYILLLQELGSIIFFYLVVGVAKGLASCHDCKPSMEKRVATAIAPIKKAATKAKKRVTKRK